MSNVWNKVQEQTRTNKIRKSKSQTIFCMAVKRIKISDIFYKIQKFLKTLLASIIATNGINFLIAGPLKISGRENRLIYNKFLITTNCIIQQNITNKYFFLPLNMIFRSFSCLFHDISMISIIEKLYN